MISEILISSVARACAAADQSYVGDVGIEENINLSRRDAKTFVRSILEKDSFEPFPCFDDYADGEKATIDGRNRLWRAIAEALIPERVDN